VKTAPHPSTFLDNNIIEKIREVSFEAETLKQLHPDQLELIFQQKLLKLFVPKKFGGLELNLLETLQVEEGLAYADGSIAWVVTLCAGAAWFVGFLDEQLVQEIFEDEKIFFAGSGMSTGTAEMIGDNFRLNGYWKYASGALHATIFTANFLIQENGKQLFDFNGNPMVRAFVLKRNEVTLHQTWNNMGMIATGTNSFEVKDIIVPKNRIFEIDSTKTTINHPIFRYPFLQLAETTLAVNLSGMAWRFIDLSEKILVDKKQTHTLKKIEVVQTQLSKYRNEFYQAVDNSWKSCVNKNSISKSDLQKVSKASHALAKASRQIVDELYPYCGLAAANTKEEINRIWRNLHTASQHKLFTSVLR